MLSQNLSRLETFPTWPWRCPELLFLNIVYSHVIWDVQPWVVHGFVILSGTRFIIPTAPGHRFAHFTGLEVWLFAKEILLLFLLLSQFTVVDATIFGNWFFFALSVIFERWLLNFLTLFVLKVFEVFTLIKVRVMLLCPLRKVTHFCNGTIAWSWGRSQRSFQVTSYLDRLGVRWIYHFQLSFRLFKMVNYWSWNLWFVIWRQKYPLGFFRLCHSNISLHNCVLVHKVSFHFLKSL